MLYDSTRCVGCLGCVAACAEANFPSVVEQGLFQEPKDLGPTAKSVVRTVQAGPSTFFLKQQCMHCVDPACVSVCMLGALHKEGEGKRDMGGERKGTGIVLYDKSICVGCRYCQIACPFSVPKFEWSKAFPMIVKCEMCRARAHPGATGPLACADPACCQACPAGAVVFGRRTDLLAEARRRLAQKPELYNGRIYGESDNGGTQVLYLAGAGVSFARLGLPELPTESSAQFSESVSHAPYLHGVTPIVLYGIAAFVVHRNRKLQDGTPTQPEEKP